MPQRPARRGEIAGHEADRGNGEPDAVFGRASSHHGHDHVRAAAEKGEERRRAECGARARSRQSPHWWRGRQVAQEPGRRGRRIAHRTSLRSVRAAHASTAMLAAATNNRMPFPPECSVDQAADQRPGHRHDHHDGGDQSQHRGGTVAIDQVADDGAPDHQPGGSAQRLDQSCDDKGADAVGEDRPDARRGRENKPASTTGRRPNRSDSGPSASCDTASPTR